MTVSIETQSTVTKSTGMQPVHTQVRQVNARRETLRYQLGFICFARFSNILRLWPHLLRIHPRFYVRGLLILFTSVVATPLGWSQRIWYGRQIRRQVLNADPVFIIGHWRSGTTHLHNLMSQDETFGVVTMFQALFPECSLIGQRWLKPLMGKIMPLKRPMDNMEWPMDAPQEEEIPLAKMFPHSFYTQFLFPQQARQLFRKYVLLEGVSGRVRRELGEKFHRLLQIATLHAQGRRLLLKNPVNTARVQLLLKKYPRAKFVYIHRSPYDVFRSTTSLHRELLAISALQPISESETEETVLTLYESLVRRYLRDRELIPAGNLVEVRFEDLEREPMKVLERIYSGLALPGFDRARERFLAYVASQGDYRKNQFPDATPARRTVEARWAFAFDAFGYHRAESTAA